MSFFKNTFPLNKKKKKISCHLPSRFSPSSVFLSLYLDPHTAHAWSPPAPSRGTRRDKRDSLTLISEPRSGSPVTPCSVSGPLGTSPTRASLCPFSILPLILINPGGRQNWYPVVCEILALLLYSQTVCGSGKRTRPGSLYRPKSVSRLVVLCSYSSNLLKRCLIQSVLQGKSHWIYLPTDKTKQIHKAVFCQPPPHP